MDKKRTNCLGMGISARALYLIIFKSNATAHHVACSSCVPAVASETLEKPHILRGMDQWESLILIAVQCVTECPYTPISIRPCDFPCPPSIDASRQAIQVLRVVRWDLHCSHPEDLRSNPVRRSSQTHLCFDKTRAIRMLGLFGRERLHEPACVSWLQTTMKLNYVGTAMTNRRAPFRRQTEKVCGCPETLVVPRSELLRPLSGSYA